MTDPGQRPIRPDRRRHRGPGPRRKSAASAAAEGSSAESPAHSPVLAPAGGPALPRIFLEAGRDHRLVHGHPWVYSNEVRMDADAKALPAGTLVTIHRTDGKPLGVGSFTPHALIAFRLFDGEARNPIDAAWIADRLRRALSLRARLFPEPYYRLVHSEADGLPGLICDRFADVVVLQVNTAGMEALTSTLLSAIDEVLAPETIVLRNDSRARAIEGLPSVVDVVKGRVPEHVDVREGGLTFLADVIAGQKTGWFFDQRDNRAWVAPLASGERVLDAFCHSGAFGLLAAAHGARQSVFLDSSEPALALARASARVNGLEDRCVFRQQEVFQALEGLGQDGERFRLVVTDPPAFVKARKELGSGLKGYRKLARLAAAVVEPGGFLLMASCSHLVTAADFLAEVVRGIDSAGRQGRILRQAGAGPDHPVHPHLPETAYLKAIVLQLD